jgi:DNA-directed RNA polymerase specialized sigma24 family protein
MNETFEELAGHHIDGLYHGALFLNAGEEPPAEDLVLWTLTGAFQEFRMIEEKGGVERWLEGRLVSVFLARMVSDPTGEVSTDAVSGEDFPTDQVSTDAPASFQPSSAALKIDPEALFGAAMDIPPLARAAVWLVLFRRWSYDEASSALDTGVEGLKDLLRYRQVLLAAVVRWSADRNGTDHDRRK